jgi:hypothetical protein
VESGGDGGERGDRLELRDDQREGEPSKVAKAMVDWVITPNSTSTGDEHRGDDERGMIWMK